jgi:class 3 adenylate cyclase/pimeloyl-ACP methyl ester carboxylesterase
MGLVVRAYNARMEPRIRYTQTSDDVSIAYWEMGIGEPLVVMPAYPVSHLQLEWRVPEWRTFFERLARHRRVIRYDGRGMGLSQRNIDPETISLETAQLDLDAVVAAAGAEQVSLLSVANAGAVALRYTAANPAQIRNLVLWCAFVQNRLPAAEAEWEAPLMRAHWDYYCVVFMGGVMGWRSTNADEPAVQVLRESISVPMGLALRRTFGEYDVRDAVEGIRVPTLVMHRRGLSPESAMRLASRIPGAQLVLFDGASFAPFVEGDEGVVTAIDEFLGDLRVDEAGPVGGALRTILFTDVQDHTSMMQRLGDGRAREVLREHERITRAALRIHGGTEVKSMGDGFLAWFASASQALECAVDLQRAFDDHNRRSREPLRVRVGINAGEPIEDDADLYGTAVVTASRIAQQATGGQVLVSNVVRELVAGKGFLFSDRGKLSLRGLDEPVRVYEVHWEPGKAPGDEAETD